METELEASRRVSEEQLANMEMQRMELEMALEIALAQQMVQEEVQYPQTYFLFHFWVYFDHWNRGDGQNHAQSWHCSG